MAQDPLAPTPATTATTNTPTSAQPPPPPPAPVRDFKKIILRQTARKFTSRPPPPRRPWPKPNYYCDYDSQEPITSSLFSSDVVFSKSVVESLFFNTRYVKAESSSSSDSAPWPGYLNGSSTLRYGVQGTGQARQDGNDEDIQIIAHFRPGSQSQTRHLNQLTPTALANGAATASEVQAKSKSTSTKCARQRPRPRPKPSTKKDKLKEPLSLIHINASGTGTLFAAEVNNSGKSPKTKKTPPKIHGLNISSSKHVINGHSSNDAKIKTSKKKLPPMDEDTESSPSPSFPTHLWSLPSLAWTQAPTPTASPSKSMPPLRTGEVTTKKTPSNGTTTPAGKIGKKRTPECLSPSSTKSKGLGQYSGRKLSPAKKPRMNGLNTHSSRQSVKSQSPSGKKRQSKINLANSVSVARPSSVPSRAKPSALNSASRKKSRMYTNSEGVLQRSIDTKSSNTPGEINDKNNNTFSQPAAVNAGVPPNQEVPRNKAEIIRVKKPKQIRINGIFKLAKKNSPTITANLKSKNRSHSIASNTAITSTEVQKQANGPRPRPNSKVKHRTDASPHAKAIDKVLVPGTITVNVTATATSSHPCNKNGAPPPPLPSPTTRASRPPCKNRPTAQPQSEASNPKPGLPVLADTRIMLVARPMTTEAPIDYSLKPSPPTPRSQQRERERTPDPETRTGQGQGQTSPSNKSTRTLRITPTKSYAYLTKRSCPCDCSASH